MVSMSSGLRKFTVLGRSIQKCYLPFYHMYMSLGTHQQHLGLTHGSFLLERFRIPQVVLLVGFEGLYVMLEIVPDSSICRASALSSILSLPPFSSAHFFGLSIQSAKIYTSSICPQVAPFYFNLQSCHFL